MITGHGDWLQKWAEVAPWRVAIREVSTGRVRHYGELSSRAWRLTHALAARGVRPGDKVALLARNTPAIFEVAFACLRLGAAYTPLNWRLAPAELADILDHCDARALYYDRTCRETAAVLFDRRPSMIGVGLDAAEPDEGLPIARSHGLYSDQIASGDDAPTGIEHGAETLGMLLYTSGTTGKPKGVMIPHRQLFWNAVNTVYATDLGPDDRALACLPLFHTGGLNCLATPAFYRGATVLLMDQFDPLLALRTIEQERATIVVAVPTMYQMLLDAGLDGYDTSSLHTLLCGGAPCPEPLLDAWLDRGFNFRQGFGMTEVGPNCFSLPPWKARLQRGSVGQPVLHGAARVDAPVGEVGELLLSGPIVCAGYLGDPENTAKSIRDGWFHTGDLARVDEDGFFHIAGRQKDMFISGGENVYPAEIESVLLEHPWVHEVTVVAVPHERWGEVGLAAVVPTEPANEIELEALSEALTAHCRERLAKFKVPKRYAIADELPKNPSGKVMKAAVRERFT